MNDVTFAATATCNSACGYACRTIHRAGNKWTVSPRKPRSRTMTFLAPRVRWRKFAGSEAAIGKSLGLTTTVHKFAHRRCQSSQPGSLAAWGSGFMPQRKRDVYAADAII